MFPNGSSCGENTLRGSFIQASDSTGTGDESDFHIKQDVQL